MDLRLSKMAIREEAKSLFSPRVIAFSDDIPYFSCAGHPPPRHVRLRNVSDAQAASFVFAFGAFSRGPFWFIPRRDPFPFDLHPHLPRMAQKSLTPEGPELFVSNSPLGSLEAMLDGSSWRRLVADTWRSERVCFECGSVPRKPERLEGFEEWDNAIDSERGFFRKLVAIRVLCPSCMEMKFLDTARQNGRFAETFDRLCTINRIRPFEKREYLSSIHHYASIFQKHRNFTYDISILSGLRSRLKPDFVFNEGVVYLPGCKDTARFIDNPFVSRR